MTYSFSPPDRQGVLWWCQGWLFVFIADDPAFDLDSFRIQHLTMVQGILMSEPGSVPHNDSDAAEPLNSTVDAPEAAPQPMDK